MTAFALKSSAQAYVWQSLSADDAVQSVRGFEGSNNLAVTVVETPSNSGVPAPWIDYVLTAGRYEYDVCAYSHDVFFRSDVTFMLDKPRFYGQPYDLDVLKQQVMSQDAAQSIARTFMLAHFPHPEVLTNIRIWPESETDHMTGKAVFVKDYLIAFFQQNALGVGGPAECRVTVDTIKGQVINYRAKYYPLLIGTVPTLSADQATASAMNALNIVQGTPKPVDGLIVSAPDALGNETLLYGVNFGGISLPFGQTDATNTYPENYIATVDAFTGDVVYASMLMSLVSKHRPGESRAFSSIRTQVAGKLRSTGSRLKFVWAGQPLTLNHSSLSVGNRAYVLADYLCSRSPASKITKKGSDFHVNGQAQDTSFRVGSQVYQINGQTKRMSGTPLLLNGLCYVPLDVMQAVLGGEWSYDAKAQTVRYDPSPIKRASR